MATEISNGRQTVKLYHSVNRGNAMYQLAYYAGGKRVQKNFADKSEAKRVAKQILGELSNDAEAVEAMATPELESLIAARRVLAPNYALHVAVEEHAHALAKLGKATLREAVEFFLRHHRADMPRLPLGDISEQFARSREQSGLSPHYVFLCRKFTRKLAEAFPGLCLSDLTTAALDNWLGNLKLGATTKNDMRRVLGTCGNWAERQGHLLKGTNPFLGMMRYWGGSAVGLRGGSGVRLFLYTPELVDGHARIGGAVELERDGRIEGVGLTVTRRERAPAAGGLPGSGQVFTGHGDLRGAAGQLHVPAGRRLGIGLGGLAAVPTLQGRIGACSKGHGVARGCLGRDGLVPGGPVGRAGADQGGAQQRQY